MATEISGTPPTAANRRRRARRTGAAAAIAASRLAAPPKAKPDRATLLGLLLGPTGNLRAPTLRKGRTLIVGFEEETYEKLLK